MSILFEDIQVKVFIKALASELEVEINRWIEKENIVIKDIKFQSDNRFYSAMIIYRKRW